MSEKEKILKKLDVRWHRYDDKFDYAKKRKSEELWLSRRRSVTALKMIFDLLLCDSYSKGKCEGILRHQLITGLASDTPMANGMVYVLDDIL